VSLVTKFTVVADNSATRTVTLRWPTGQTITAHYPTSAVGPEALGWSAGDGTCWAWAVVDGRVPWIFAFDLT
jgi:hypothetical protein